MLPMHTMKMALFVSVYLLVIFAVRAQGICSLGSEQIQRLLEQNPQVSEELEKDLALGAKAWWGGSLDKKKQCHGCLISYQHKQKSVLYWLQEDSLLRREKVFLVLKEKPSGYKKMDRLILKKGGFVNLYYSKDSKEDTLSRSMVRPSRINRLLDCKNLRPHQAN